MYHVGNTSLTTYCRVRFKIIGPRLQYSRFLWCVLRRNEHQLKHKYKRSKDLTVLLIYPSYTMLLSTNMARRALIGGNKVCGESAFELSQIMRWTCFWLSVKYAFDSKHLFYKASPSHTLPYFYKKDSSLHFFMLDESPRRMLCLTRLLFFSQKVPFHSSLFYWPNVLDCECCRSWSSWHCFGTYEICYRCGWECWSQSSCSTWKPFFINDAN